MADNTNWYQRLPAQIGAGLAEGLGLPATIGESVLGLGNRGLEALTGRNDLLPKRISFNPAANILSTLTGYTPPSITPYTMDEIRQGFSEPIFGKELLQPKTFVEKVAKTAAQQVPLAVATGGLGTAAQAGRLLAGTTGSVGAQELGLPAPIQFFAGIGAERGFDKLLNRLSKNPLPRTTLNTMAQEAKNQFYAKEKELGSQILVNNKPIKRSFSKLKDQIYGDRKLKEAERTQLISDIEHYEKQFFGDAISADDLTKARTELNYNAGKARGADKNYYEALNRPIKDTIKAQSQKHPNWFKALEDADALHKAQNFRESFMQGLEDYPKLQKVLSNPLSYGVASLGPTFFLTKDPISSLLVGTAITGGAYGTQKALDVIGFLSGEQPKRLLLKASQEMIKQNYPAALRTYAQLNNEANKYEKRQNEKLKASTKRLVPLDSPEIRRQTSGSKVTQRLIAR